MPTERHILRGTERALGTVSEEMKQQSAKPQEQSLFHEQLKWQSFAKCSNGGLMGVSTEIIQQPSKEECAVCVCATLGNSYKVSWMSQTYFQRPVLTAESHHVRFSSALPSTSSRTLHIDRKVYLVSVF